jgi:tripartite-type tricarboxylate transporter receptor subunit TctC
MQRWTRAVALVAMLAPAWPAAAEDFPARPIRAIASQGAGGLSDLFMRGLADQLGPALGTSIVVEDRTGAGGTIGARACAESPPDGYTICILPGEATVMNPITDPIPDFDPGKQLAPITRAFFLTQVFAVNASLNVKSFADLAALAKAKPGTLNYMAPSVSQVAFIEQFNKKNGTDLVRIPFKGGGDAVNSMLTGTTQIAVFGIGNLVQFIRDGKIIGLAVDGDTRSPLAPEISTFKELGYRENILPTSFGIFAPTGTPKPIIDRLYKAIAAVASKPDFQQKFLISRGLAPALSSPEQFAKEIPEDRAETLAAVKASGLYPDVK